MLIAWTKSFMEYVAAAVRVTVLVSELVTAGPVGGLALTVATLTTAPALTSPWVSV